MLNKITAMILILFCGTMCAPAVPVREASSSPSDLCTEASEAYVANLEGLSDEHRHFCKQMWNSICAGVISDLERYSENLGNAWCELDSFIEHLEQKNPDLSTEIANKVADVKELCAYVYHLNAKMNLANAELNIATIEYFCEQHAEQIRALQDENDALREELENKSAKRRAKKLREQFLFYAKRKLWRKRLK